MTDPVRLAAVADVEPDSSLRVDIDGHRIALIRLGDDFYAIGDECSHADVSLAEGEIDGEEKAIECWKHGSLFCLETGAALTLPATRPVPSYRIEVVDGQVLAHLEAEEER
jgi:3-phenylpropionate/trans-cinnamate dioxygenase ferredoxin subunit